VLDRANHFPSPEDAEGFLYEDLAQQAMIIFHKNSAAIITKTPKTKRLLRSLPKHEIKKRLVKVEQAILELSNRPNITNKAALLQPVYETLGLRLTFVKPKQALNIPIKVRN